MNENDSRYNFYINGDYKKTIEYIKAHSLFVYKTKVAYIDNSEGKNITSDLEKYWLKNFIYSSSFTPHREDRFPVIVACVDYDINQFQNNIIESIGSYIFDYYNSLEISLLPKTTMSISLLYSDYNKNNIKKQPIRYSLSIKNNTDESQIVNLFDDSYYKSVCENKSVEIESIFGKGDYENVIKQFENIPLVAKNIQVICGEKNIISKCKINSHEFKLMDYYTLEQQQADVIDINLLKETYIHNMSIEVKPNTELLISFK